ncbi:MULTISPECIES: acyltransferase family protein [Niastella]|uniref:Acyltransferase n=1 Tax=Niastella soli TaxID=2821487 RepID=A0ABS3YSQ2_9BACT|nr:acyltransferase [Niastella soli]MBO9200915.1 acyltransferase [Niastella soli]
MNKHKLIPSLNGLRAISILLVIFGHYGILNDTLRKFYPLQILENGSLGVNVFFAISGFLITTLLIEEEKKTGTISLKSFYKRRTLRIFPAYYFMLLVYFILQRYNLIFLSGNSWLTALTYTKYFNHSLDIYSEHLWSLSVEEHFYLCWPFIFYYFPSRKTFVLLFFIILVPFLRIFGNVRGIPYFEIDSITIFQRADSLLLGCLLALHYDKFCLFFNKLFKSIKFPLLFIFLMLTLIQYLAVALQLTKWHFYFTVPLLGPSGTITILLILMLIVYSINCTGWWYTFLNSRIMDYIGRLSYSLYLWQQIIIFGSLKFVPERPYSLLVIFLVANVSYYFIERPFLALKNKYNNPPLQKSLQECPAQ